MALFQDELTANMWNSYNGGDNDRGNGVCYNPRKRNPDGKKIVFVSESISKPLRCHFPKAAKEKVLDCIKGRSMIFGYTADFLEVLA
jgi:hypothetical protein